MMALQLTRSRKALPSRVVILGAQGFVARAIHAAMADVPVVALGQAELDLLAPDAGTQLSERLQPSDCLVMVSAKAPCKTHRMLVENTAMAASVCEALSKSPIDHLVYISSDAVYSDIEGPITEETPTLPDTLHGIMHLTREVMLRTGHEGALAILRPSLLYGPHDPHNGYGPNRFRRLAAAGDDIVLFGSGDECRDHVYIGDVAALVRNVILGRGDGVLNVATGKVTSFFEIAQHVLHALQAEGNIVTTKRDGPMPHLGYRSFSVKSCRSVFPDFRFTPFIEAFRQTLELEGLG